MALAKGREFREERPRLRLGGGGRLSCCSRPARTDGTEHGSLALLAHPSYRRSEICNRSGRHRESRIRGWNEGISGEGSPAGQIRPQGSGGSLTIPKLSDWFKERSFDAALRGVSVVAHSPGLCLAEYPVKPRPPMLRNIFDGR